ncbi:hypothetical protein THAOC_25875 [Thalassiosira oceanica]|uniref:Uncharacterized protein n=1 Tax=Thalassiosira oceanica TaxID=159749 RepID=K0RL90_THAOC|nr:hypothetical protein THAOC_25875 [Thalassiosira oceanica]|eukprot:EJK54493.1 hypothetical protein THAOC_25875 [Thalassiosira oceanica]
MKWLRPDDRFGADRGGYSAMVYWYMSCEHLSPKPKRSLVMEDQQGADVDDNGAADMDYDVAQDNQDRQHQHVVGNNAIGNADINDEGGQVEGLDDDLDNNGSVGDDDGESDFEMLNQNNAYDDYISRLINRFGLVFFSSLEEHGDITDELSNGNCGHLALVRCLGKHGCLFSPYGDKNPGMKEWRSNLVDFWNNRCRNFRIPLAGLRPPDWRLVVSYPDGTPLRVGNRIFRPRPDTDYDNGAAADQWLEMNEVMSIVAYWKKYSIVVYMRDKSERLNRTYFFIYDQAEDHVTHVTHSHPTRWLSPPPRSITLHYIQGVHFQSYSFNFRATCLDEIYGAVQKYMCFEANNEN